MPPARKFQPASFSLSDEDMVNLAKLSNALGKRKAEVARDAIRWYIEEHQKITNKEREDRIVQAIFKSTDRIIAVIQKCTERIAALQVRAIIDHNITLMFNYRLLPGNQADTIMASMYRMAISRLTRKLPPEELRITSMISEGLEQEIIEQALPRKVPQQQNPADKLPKAS